MTATTDIQTMMDNAQAHFWRAIADQNPHITHGDFPPDLTHAFDTACLDAVKAWLQINDAPEEIHDMSLGGIDIVFVHWHYKGEDDGTGRGCFFPRTDHIFGNESSSKDIRKFLEGKYGSTGVIIIGSRNSTRKKRRPGKCCVASTASPRPSPNWTVMPMPT